MSTRALLFLSFDVVVTVYLAWLILHRTVWWNMRVEVRKLFKRYLHAELLYTRVLTSREKVFLGGLEPMVVGPGRIEVLLMPLSEDEQTWINGR